jgi:membrane protease YdiL (CAAX protease family)
LTLNPITYQTPPPPYSNEPRTAGQSRFIIAAAWVVICACLAFVAYANWRMARTPGRVQATENFQLQLTSRVAVGEMRVASAWPQFHDSAKGQVIAQLSKFAISPGEKLRLAIVAGEVEGGRSALDKLDAVAGQLKSPEAKSDLATLRTIYKSGPPAVSQDARDELVRHEGWFGELALSFGRPDSDPLRARLMRAAVRAFVVTITVEGVAVLAALVGLGLFIFFMIRLAGGQLHLCYGRAPTLTTAFLESFAVYLAGYVAIGLLARLLAPRVMFLGTILSLLWMPFAMLWPLWRGLSWQQLKGGLGWYRGRGIFREIGAGITGYIAGLPLVLIAMIVTIILTSRTESNVTHPIVLGQTHGVWPILELYLLASAFAPLVEETMFRGALFTHLRQRHGWFMSAVISSFIFAALHPQGWTAIPVLGTIGFVFAGIREWRGTFIASAAAHALNNGVMVTVLILVMR